MSQTDKKTCAYCEYFDGGGRAAVEQSKQQGKSFIMGDCLNRHSDRFTTSSNGWCSSFHLDTTDQQQAN